MTTRRTLSLIVTLALAGTLVFPAAAAPFDGPTDRFGSDLQIAPSSDYATVEDGHVVVDLTGSNPAVDAAGVNADARTTFADVFRIRYTGSQYADVWLTHDSPAISFAIAGQPVDSRTNNVTLAPSESVPVTLVVDTTEGDFQGSVGDFTVHSRVAETATTEDVDDSLATTRSVIRSDGSRLFTALTTDSGGAIRFDADRMVLDHVGGQTLALESVSVGTTGGSLSLSVDTVDSETAEAVVQDGSEPLGGTNVTVENGAVRNGTLRFSVSAGYFETRNVSPGDLVVYRRSDGSVSRLDVTTTGAQDGRLTFAAETTGFSEFVVAVDRPQIRVDSASVNSTTVQPGQFVEVTATVSNHGNAAGERAVQVTLDESVVAERTVDLAPGETETVTVPVAPNATGEHRVAVDGVDAGSVVVEAAEDATTTQTATPTEAPSSESNTATETAASTETETATAAAPPSDTDGPVEESSSFGLDRLLGLLGLLIAMLATITLARRVT